MKRIPCWIPVCVLGVLVAFHPTIFSGFRQMQVDPGDTRLVNYFLEHGYRWATGQLHGSGFWNPRYFFPQQNVLAYSETLLGVGPLYWIWRGLGMGPESSFQVWLILVSVLNFVAVFTFLKRWFVSNPCIAAVGAYLFAFGSPRINQLIHPQLLAQFFPVLALHALGYILGAARLTRSATAKRSWLFVFFAASVLQLYSGFYHGWFLGFCLVIGFLWSLSSRQIRARYWLLLREDWLWIAGLGLVSAVALLPLARHYQFAAGSVGVRRFDDVVSMIPPLQAWFHLGTWNLLYSWLFQIKLFKIIPLEHEQRIGIGIVSFGLVILGIYLGVRRTQKQVALKVLFLTFATLFVVFLQFNGYTLFRYIFSWFPGASGLRGFCRVGVFLLLSHAIALVLALDWVRKWSKQGLVVALSLFCMTEQVVSTVSFNWRGYRRQFETVKQAIGPRCGYFLYSPILGPDSFPGVWKYQIDAMWAQLESGVPTLNGYSGNMPPGWAMGDNLIRRSFDDARIQSAVHWWIKKNSLIPGEYCLIRIPAGPSP